LRASSSNLRVLQAAQQLTPSNTRLSIFAALESLPPFNPDTEPNSSPAVQTWVDAMRNCDGVVLSSPIYAGGYPGSLKNALDWLVNTDAFVAKPFALLNATTRNLDVQDSLIRVLETMSGKHVTEASVAINLLGSTTTVADIVADPAIATKLTGALSTFADHLRS